MTTVLTRTFSTVPPRSRRVFSRIPRSDPWNTQLLITMLRTPPLISLPITTPPCPRTIVHPVMVTFSVATRSGVRSVPALSAMQSSPTSMWQSLMRTLRQDSGSMPSVFGESAGLWMCRFVRVTSSQREGCTVQAGELRRATSRIVTRSHSCRPIRVGRGWASSSRRWRKVSHQICPPPSIVPSPVIATSRSPCAYRQGEWPRPTAPSQRASTARYSAGSGTNCSSAPASRCSSTPLRRRSAPVRCTPAGTLTRPPPAAAASSRARCHCVVATAGSTRSCGGEVGVTAEPFGAGGPTGGEGRQGGDGAVCGAGCGTVPCGGSGVELLVRLGVLGDDVVQALAAGALDRGLVVAHRGLAHHELVVDVVQALLDGGPLGVEGLR